jgi:hypothetical protein
MDRKQILQQMIEEYRRKIDTYQSMIREWEAEVGLNGSKGIGMEVYLPAPEHRKSEAGDPISIVREFQFYNKSQPDAAKMLLEMVGHPLKTNIIIEGIEKGGVKVGGKTAKDKKTNLYTILHRGEDFALVGKDAWGLATWPGAKKDAKNEEEKEEKKE